MKTEPRKRQKLLIVKFPLESAWGGEEEIHLLLAQELRKKGHEVALLTSCPFFIAGFAEQNFYTKKSWHFPDPVSKISLLFLPLTAIFFFFTGIFHLSFFRAKGYRQVLFLRLGEKVLWTPFALLLGYRVFWGEHCTFGRWLKQNPLLPLYRLLSTKTTFICPSKVMAEQIHAINKNAHIKIIANAPSTKKNLSQKKTSKANLFALLKAKVSQEAQKIPKNAIFVGFSGRLSREKGLTELIEIAQKITKKHPEVFFLLAGEGKERHALTKKIQETKTEKNVFLLGFLDQKELENFYLGLDIFCLFSDFETFGLVLLEAMSAGLPIVATAKGAIPEIITSGKNGFLVEHAQEAEKPLKELIKDKALRTQMGANGKALFKKQFTAAIFGKRAEKAFFIQK